MTNDLESAYQQAKAWWQLADRSYECAKNTRFEGGDEYVRLRNMSFADEAEHNAAKYDRKGLDALRGINSETFVRMVERYKCEKRKEGIW